MDMNFFLLVLLLHGAHRALIQQCNANTPSSNPCEAKDPPPPCSCYAGCDMTKEYVDYNGIKKINVALNRKTEEVVNHLIADDPCMAVNGLIDMNTFKKKSKTTGCYATTLNLLGPHFRLTLSRPYYINHIVIIRPNTDRGLKMIGGVSVFVDGRFYFQFPKFTDREFSKPFYQSVEYHLHNKKPWTGLQVELKKPGYSKLMEHKYKEIFICEVQVLICPHNRYGEHCNLSCDPERTKYAPCDHYRGAIIPPEPMNVGYRKDALAMTTSETWQAVFKTQDGDYSQHISHCFRSWRQYPTGHWWSMDLGSQSFLTISVRIWGRGDCCGDDLKDFFISVAEKLPHRTAHFEDNEKYRGKVCLRHPGFLEQGEIYHGLCNNGYGLRGRYVLILKRPERKARMVICEVHVYALRMIVLPPVGSGKCKTCQLFYQEGCPRSKWTLEPSPFQGLAPGRDCSINGSHCAWNTLCDGGLCRLRYGADCSRRPNMCQLDTMCEKGSRRSCVLGPGDDCTSPAKTVFCPGGTLCDSGRCRGPLDYVCNGNSNACPVGYVCDSVYGICKLPVNFPCSPGGDSCQTGAVCRSFCQCDWNSTLAFQQVCIPLPKKVKGQCSPSDGKSACQDPNARCNSTTKKCECINGFTTHIPTLSCEPVPKKVTGPCSPSDGKSACDDPNARCNPTTNKCECNNGFTVFMPTLTCLVNPGGPCNSDKKCSHGTTCQTVGGTKKCTINKGKSCVGKENLCQMSTVCDRDSKTCRSDVGETCTRTSDCRTGTSCVGSKCKLNVGQNCSQHRSDCVPDSQCDQIHKTCRIVPGKSCEGPANVALCLSGSVCDRDSVCRPDAGQNCNAGDRKCRHGLLCSGAKCKVKQGGNCTAAPNYCVPGTICDNLNTCKTPTGTGGCTAVPGLCVSGSRCVDGKCKCVPGTNPSGGKCEPTDQKPLGRCSPNKGGSACLDPNAECRNGTCRCIAGFTEDSEDYSCKLAPGKHCVAPNENNCTSGTICDDDEKCGLDLGVVCDALNTEARCAKGAVCGVDDTCNIDKGKDCSGNKKKKYCATGTVCDSQDRCREPVGKQCYHEGECVVGAECANNTCSCVKGVATAQGPECDPNDGQVGGKCSPACSDANAICGDDKKCHCREGFTMAQQNLTCKLSLGSKCEDNKDLCESGTVCDPEDNTCKLRPGESCEGSRNKSCVSFTMCDESKTCTLKKQGNCSGSFIQYCPIGTVCDNFFTCSTQEGGECDDDLPGKQCVAGAECVNSTCRCLTGVAVRTGVLCVPESGYIDGDCEPVESPCYDPNAICELSSCRCKPGFRKTTNYGCEEDTGQQHKAAQTGRLWLFLGGGLLIFILALILSIMYSSWRHKRTMRALTEMKGNMERTLQSLREETSAFAEETSYTGLETSHIGLQTSHTGLETSHTGLQTSHTVDDPSGVYSSAAGTTSFVDDAASSVADSNF